MSVSSQLGVVWSFLNPILDVGIVSYLIYRALLLIKGTRALRMLMGGGVLIALFFLSKDLYLDLPTLNWIFEQFMASIIVVIVIVFQDDIRRALSQVGRNPIVGRTWSTDGERFYESIIRAVTGLAAHRLGALIALERDGDLSAYTEQGVRIDGEMSAELIFSLFANKQFNPLHDGAAIVQKGRVSFASCFLPLTVNPKVERDLGTRHRAAIGLSEETDALVIVVSEETGTISVALGGNLQRGYDEESLRNLLHGLFGEEPRSTMQRLWTLRRGGKR